MKYIVSYIVIVVMLLIVITSMSNVERVLGQQENTPMPTCPENSWRFDEGGECTTCENGWWSALGCFWTPIPPPEPIQQLSYPYPEPYIDPYPVPIVEAGDVDSDNKVETIARMYASAATPTPTSVWIETVYCVKFVTHSICRR